MEISLGAALKEAAVRSPDTPAVITPGQTLDFAEFDRRSDRIAAGLAQRGINKGDRIGLYCINGAEFALAYFAIQQAGATVVPINLLLNPEEVVYMLRDAGVSALIYHEALSQGAAAVLEQLHELQFTVCIGAASADPAHVTWQTLLDSRGPVPQPEMYPPDDLAAILYTSGTTGYPKGAMLTHRNLVRNAESVRQAMPLTPGEDRVLVVLPMFHAFAAMAGMIYPLLSGCTMVPLPRFNPAETAAVIGREQIAMFFGVPSMYNLFLRLPEECTPLFAPLKYCISGGAAMPVDVMEAFEKRFGKLIYEGDGPTECSPVTCVNPIGGRRKAATVGLPVTDVEMKVLDEEGRECPHGEVGEICVRGPNVMKGYWNRPEDTQAAFWGEWFRTGDLGTEDDEGYFSIVDRKKDMVIVNGMNVYPRMVEEVLYRHPAVHEAAVVGAPDRRHGEIPVAFIALHENNAAVDDRTLRHFCMEHLGRHEVPRRFIFMDALPKNAAGKILKRELRTSGEWERGFNPVNNA
jgi:long-chain acyl-CoA synthetase